MFMLPATGEPANVSDCTITSKDQARLTVEEAWELGTCLFKRARPKEELAVRGVGGEVRVWE